MAALTLYLTFVLLALEVSSVRVGQTTRSVGTRGNSVGSTLNFGLESNSGFVDAESTRDFVAHFFSKENLGVIFSAGMRVTGFYKDRKTGNTLPAEESGMIRIGDQIISINDAKLETLQDLKDAIAAAELPLHLKFRPPPGNADDRYQKTCGDFLFNVTIYSSTMPSIDLSVDEFIVISSEVDALQPGDKLVAVSGENIKGMKFDAVKRKIDRLFVQEVLRCQKTHCQVEKVPDYSAAKVLTFEPTLPSYRQGYTIYDVAVNECSETDTDCQQLSDKSLSTTADNDLSLSPIAATNLRRRRTLLQSVGHLQQATLTILLHLNDTTVIDVTNGSVTGTAYSSLFPCGEFPIRRARPVYACSPLKSSHTGDFVLVRSGSCSAYDKAMNVQYAGARGILLMDELLTKKNARDLSTHPLHVATMKLDAKLTQAFFEISDKITTQSYTAWLKTPRCHSASDSPE